VGSSWTFVLALGVVLVWAITGPMFDYSDTWQLLINTGTTIVTFLMVFLIQNAQNREGTTQLKLDRTDPRRQRDPQADDGCRRPVRPGTVAPEGRIRAHGRAPDDPVRQRLRRSLGRGAVARSISSTGGVQEQPDPPSQRKGASGRPNVSTRNTPVRCAPVSASGPER
jgi:hypothetical protein